MTGALRAVVAILTVAVCFADGAVSAAPETVWLRIVNAVDGPVQVRLGDSGSWVTLGHVVLPATRTAPGFGASRWAAPGTVAATAVHGIRLKIADGEFGPMISLVPREFAAIPEFYGGHVPGQSGIRTDIGAGKTLFREWAPLTGSRVYLELASGPMGLPANYVPAPGDVLLVASRWRDDAPRSITFDNRKGGGVTAFYAGGRTERLGIVTQALSGVGRYDGTSYTGVGYINTNHPGVITVSTAPVVSTTAPEGAPPERRGGFMISPSIHVADQASGTPQVMGIGPNRGEPGWEGRYPLFSGAIGLWPPGPAFEGFHADMQVDGGQWEPLPAIVGKDDAAFTAKGLARYLTGRTVGKGVTAIRLTLPAWDPAAAAEALKAAEAAQPAPKREPTGVYSAVKGTLSFTSKGAPPGVTYIVDGQFRGYGNAAGFTWTWDTTKEANGRHWLEVVREDEFGKKTTGLRRVVVLNDADAHR